MAAKTAIFSFLLLLSLSLPTEPSPSPYLYTTTLFQNYQNMLKTFKIFIYAPPKPPFSFPDPPSSIFYNSLIRSQFLTLDPTQAHLFFVAFAPDTSTRSLERVIRDIRNNHPYWNRTLGADHFFISPAGIDYSSNRNILELKKNSIQISTFPVTSGHFIPHKDITLPPFKPLHAPMEMATPVEMASLLGYLRWNGKMESSLLNDLKNMNADFLVESEPLDRLQSIKRSKFCLFFHGGDEVTWMVEAMGFGCVPVVIVEHPIQDLPLMDVLRWSDVVFLVSAHAGGERVRELLSGVREEKYAEMRRLCVGASRHLVWNAEAKPYDAFHMVMYQLWSRRHTIRYARKEVI